MIYKVSYVVLGGLPGIIRNQSHPPKVGERIEIGEHLCEIVEIVELLPPQGDYAYLHATCRPVEEPASET